MFKMMPLFVMLLAATLLAEQSAWTTDPYPLPTDPTGASLADVDQPIVLLHEGRHLRFASRENADAFAQDPAPYLAEVDRRIIALQSPIYPLTTCPISGEALDAMGEPVMHVFGNRLVKFCCDDCVEQFKEDPEATIRKLDEAVIAQQSQAYPLDTCPVCGKRLGGRQVQYVFANRLVKLCCADCQESFIEQITRYLSKLPSVTTARATEESR